MAHQFRVREIAQQAGLSEATVDRVLHRRGGVRQGTIDEVEQAIKDLSRQRSQIRVNGRTFLVDLVIDSPARFSTAAQGALESVLPGLRPAVLRSRFHFTQSVPGAEQARILDRIAEKGSQGVILKAPDVPEITAAVARLEHAGIPVITFVTDLPTSPRQAYVGLDNRSAGATAAYLMDRWLAGTPGRILVTRGDGSFRGEDEREMGFRGTLRAISPDRGIVELLHPGIDDDQQLTAVRDLLEKNSDITGVYSMYAFGSNRTTLAAFAELHRECRVFIAHDMDSDNVELLVTSRISAVLEHDLREDLRQACRMIMQAHGALPGRPRSWFSTVRVVTPYNLPAPHPT